MLLIGMVSELIDRTDYLTEISFPSSLFAHERAFIRKRAKQLGFYAVTKKFAFDLL